MKFVLGKEFETISMPNFPKSHLIVWALISTFVIPIVTNAQMSESLDDKFNAVENRAAPSFENLQWVNTDWQKADFRGKVVLVNFWGSWCPPCIEELPSIQRLWNSHSRSDFDVVAINVGEDEPTINKFLSTFIPRLEFPIVVDEDIKTYHVWEVGPLPTSLIVDRKGQIRYSAIGGRDFDSDNIRTIIKQLLSE